MKEKEIAKDQEAVMRQCTQDIFWYKVSEVPLTVWTVAGSGSGLTMASVGNTSHLISFLTVLHLPLSWLGWRCPA